MLDAIVAAKKRRVDERNLQLAAAQHRKAQWRRDLAAAENSMGFHAPQEVARILGEVIDHARQGQLEAERTMRKLLASGRKWPICGVRRGGGAADEAKEQLVSGRASP